MADCTEAISGNTVNSEKTKDNYSQGKSKKTMISTASANVETHKDSSVQQFFNLLMNQIRGIFKGHIEIQSEINITPDEADKIQEEHKATFLCLCKVTLMN